MNLFYLNLLLVTLLGKVRLMVSFAESEAETADSKEGFCVCVPYWQCKEDYSGFIEDGLNIIDIRRLPSEDGCIGDFDVCCHTECGKRGSSSVDTFSERNLFGVQIRRNGAEFAEFPWMLALLEDKVYVCGGSLIHPQVAITAAHCVANKKQIVIRAGEWDWAANTEPSPHQDRKVKKIILHPSYHPASLRNDVALVVLDSSFTLSDNVGMVCLPRQDTQPNKMNCIATGWGNQRGQYYTTLKKVELAILSSQWCLQFLRAAFLGPFFNLHSSFICAGGLSDTCKGDGGGPLVCPIGDSDRYEQVGIVSWGLAGGGWGVPGVYVNLGMFRDWIDTSMRLMNFSVDSYKYTKNKL